MRGSPSALADLLGPGSRPRALGQLLEAGRRRSRSGTPRPGRSGRRAGRRGRGGSCGRPAGGPGGRSSARAAGQLEADQVGAEQPLEDLAPPRQLLEQLGRRERDVQEEADPQVGPQLAQHLRAPAAAGSRAPRPSRPRRPARRPLGEPLVDRDVGVPPLAVELRLGDDVVVERPQRAVGEALVVTPRSPRRTSASGPASCRRPRTARGPARCRRASRSRRRRWRASPARWRVTRPPGERRQPDVPSGSSTRSTGSRFATMTRS